MFGSQWIFPRDGKLLETDCYIRDKSVFMVKTDAESP